MAMVTYEAHLKSASVYSQSRHYDKNDVPKTDKESDSDYEARTWRHRMHSVDGEVIIPATAIKNMLSDTARFLGMKIPGKGKSTFTKHFEAGVMVIDPVRIGVRVDAVQSETLFVPADGKRGGARRVTKMFPRIDEWRGVAKIYVLDQTITAEVLEEHLIEGGKFIGLGRFRPRNNGYYGRFTVSKIETVG